jgi:hypothetical protein
MRLGRVRPEELRFATQATSFVEARALVRRVEGTKRVVELHRRASPRASTVDVARLVLSALDASPAE